MRDSVRPADVGARKVGSQDRRRILSGSGAAYRPPLTEPDAMPGPGAVGDQAGQPISLPGLRQLEQRAPQDRSPRPDAAPVALRARPHSRKCGPTER